MGNISEEQVLALLEKQNKAWEVKLRDAQAKSGMTVASVDYSPETKYTYVGNGASIDPLYNEPIMDHEMWMSIYHPTPEQKAALVGSTIDHDREEDCYVDEKLGLYQEFKSLLQKAVKTNDKGLYGSTISSNDFAVLKVNIDVSRTLGFQLANNVLEQAVTVQSAPNLQAKYRTWSGFEIMPHVGEAVKVEAKKGDMAETTYKIQKDVGAAAITIEAELTLDSGIFGDHVTWIAKKMRKLRNTKIATALNTTTNSVSGADYGVYTGDRSTNDPGESLLTVVNQLNPNGYAIDTIVSHPQVKREYFQNTFIKGIFPANPVVTNSPATFNTPGIQGEPTWYADADITTTTIAFAYAKEVVVLFEGPKRQTEISRPDVEVREYYSRDFNDVFIVDQNGIRKLTGLTA